MIFRGHFFAKMRQMLLLMLVFLIMNTLSASEDLKPPSNIGNTKKISGTDSGAANKSPKTFDPTGKRTNPDVVKPPVGSKGTPDVHDDGKTQLERETKSKDPDKIGGSIGPPGNTNIKGTSDSKTRDLKGPVSERSKGSSDKDGEKNGKGSSEVNKDGEKNGKGSSEDNKKLEKDMKGEKPDSDRSEKGKDPPSGGIKSSIKPAKPDEDDDSDPEDDEDNDEESEKGVQKLSDTKAKPDDEDQMRWNDVNYDDDEDEDRGSEENQPSRKLSAQVKPKTLGIKKVDGTSDTNSSSSFVTYFVIAAVIIIVLYLVFHNKKKLMAYIIEGRNTGRARRNRATSGAEYKPLKNPDEGSRTESA